MWRSRTIYIFLAIALVVVAAISLYVGTTGIGLPYYWSLASKHPARLSGLWRWMASLPLPRLAIGMLAGASLATAGAVFQALFRNPLASPYTLGVSSGASLGATIAILFVGSGVWHGLPVVSLAAFAGAMACVLAVYAIAQLRGGHSTGTLLLAGVTIGFLCSAGIVLVLFLAQRQDMSIMLQWMMGSLEILGFDPVYEALATAALAGGVAAYLHRDLDLLMMGETVAASRGVEVRRSRRLLYFAASLLTAGVVAHCGPIGFIGLLIPHIMRFFVGAGHRRLLPACALAGAAFLPLCDLLARNAMWWLRGESRQVPVGVLTNLVGGTFFLYLLLSRRNDRPAL
jgi:iron complex transport system permease protein